MFSTPAFFPGISQHLSKVLDDVGVNEDVCFVRRKTNLLMERMEGLKSKVCCEDSDIYYFGSQTEGSTTAGMGSDKDKLTCRRLINVVQKRNEYEQSKYNMVMVENLLITPGYCYIKLTEPIPPKLRDHSAFDNDGNFFLLNTFLHNAPVDVELGNVRQGPAQSQEEFNIDHVTAFACKSWPISAKQFEQCRGNFDWLGDHMIKQAEQTGCFVVPTGNSLSENEKYEWRISTSRAERCFMFNMNITQIKCYTMLKIIMKGIIKPLVGEALTSFQCKSVMMNILERTKSQPWTEDRLLLYVDSCLRALRECVRSNNCPHYFIPRNNLLGGRIQRSNRRKIEQELTKLISDGFRRFLTIPIDQIGERIALRVSNFLEIDQKTSLRSVGDANEIRMAIFGQLFSRFFAAKWMFVYLITLQTIQESTNILPAMAQNLFALNYIGSESALMDAADVMGPVLYNSVACMIASQDLSRQRRISEHAMKLFDKGVDSDVAAGRLKLASMFYCSGDLNRAEEILDEVERRLEKETVLTVCNCRSTEPLNPEYEVPDAVKDPETDSYGKLYFVSGVQFTRQESFCVPKELQFEMFRCTGEELEERGQILFHWNDWAVVDARPYLYFLKYLIAKQHGRLENKENALDKLAQTVDSEPQLFHRETALNLLGQCMETEGNINFAFVCYRWSIMEKPTHNAARWLLGALLSKMYRNVGSVVN